MTHWRFNLKNNVLMHLILSRPSCRPVILYWTLLKALIFCFFFSLTIWDKARRVWFSNLGCVHKIQIPGPCSNRELDSEDKERGPIIWIFKKCHWWWWHRWSEHQTLGRKKETNKQKNPKPKTKSNLIRTSSVKLVPCLKPSGLCMLLDSLP